MSTVAAWALVIWIGTVNAGGPAVIHGYSSEEACREAARSLSGREIMGWKGYTTCLEVK